ncbi:MAG: helix-turn-helix domain-containing protein [Burkholderiales bacterium]|jgi:predicted transcriptional regulator
MKSDVKSFRVLIEEMKSAVADRRPAGLDEPRHLYASEAARADAETLQRSRNEPGIDGISQSVPTESPNLNVGVEHLRHRQPPERRRPVGVVSAGTLASVVRLISDENQVLLQVIAQGQARSVAELAARTRRAESNLSRTLKKLEGMGLLRMSPGRGRAKVPELAVRSFTVEVDVVSGNATVMSAVLLTLDQEAELRALRSPLIEEAKKVR